MHCLSINLYSTGDISISSTYSIRKYFGDIKLILNIVLETWFTWYSSLANYIVAHGETQSKRVSNFRDFVCSLFPNAILFDFYFTKVLVIN